jgi:hypothetical protein
VLKYDHNPQYKLKRIFFMADDSQKALKEAAKAYKSGDRQKAQQILLNLVSTDDQNERAWLLLSAVVETLEDREVALENVITLNPNNEKARKGLELVRQKLAARKPSEPLGGAGWSNIDTDTVQQHETYGWDGPAEGDDQNPFAASDSPPITEQIDWGGVPQSGSSGASSVDWGSEEDSAQAAYGSGRQIDQPSASEYDNMIGGLGLPGSESESDSSGESGWGDIDPDAIFGSTSSTADSSSDLDDSGWGSMDTATQEAAANTASGLGNSPASEPVVSDDDPFAGWESSGEATSSDAFASSDWDSADQTTASNDDPWADFGAWDEPDATASPAASEEPFGSTDSAASSWDIAAKPTDADSPASDSGSWAAADSGDQFGSTDDPFTSSQPHTPTSDFSATDDPFGSEDDPLTSSQPAEKSSGFGIASDSFGIVDDPFASDQPDEQRSGFEAADDPFASSQSAPQGGGFGSVANDPFGSDDDPFASSQPVEQRSGFGPADDPFGTDDDLFGADDDPFATDMMASPIEQSQTKVADKKRKKKSAASTIKPEHAEYFKLIPTEIEAPASPLAGNSTALIGVLVLVLLNVAAVIGIISQL